MAELLSSDLSAGRANGSSPSWTSACRTCWPRASSTRSRTSRTRCWSITSVTGCAPPQASSRCPSATRRPETLPYTSLLYEHLVGIIQDCPAATKLIILDCCHAELAGRATSLPRSGGSRPDLGPANGGYFIGASAHDSKARAPLDGGVTYFTRAFVNVVGSGLPDQPRELPIEQIFRALREQLRDAGLPEPVQSKIRDAGDYLFARNAAPSLGNVWPPGTERRFQGRGSRLAVGAS
jgi:hypothetical protein